MGQIYQKRSFNLDGNCLDEFIQEWKEAGSRSFRDQ